MDSICSHEGGPLKGTLDAFNLTCPWHYAVFIRNATVSDATVWATELSSYPVRIEETTSDMLLDLHEENKLQQQ
jgi:nitrite reductase/ring-hydroxylating ferredoxin subunit